MIEFLSYVIIFWATGYGIAWILFKLIKAVQVSKERKQIQSTKQCRKVYKGHLK